MCHKLFVCSFVYLAHPSVCFPHLCVCFIKIASIWFYYILILSIWRPCNNLTIYFVGKITNNFNENTDEKKGKWRKKDKMRAAFTFRKLKIMVYLSNCIWKFYAALLWKDLTFWLIINKIVNEMQHRCKYKYIDNTDTIVIVLLITITTGPLFSLSFFSFTRSLSLCRELSHLWRNMHKISQMFKLAVGTIKIIYYRRRCLFIVQINQQQ